MRRTWRRAVVTGASSGIGEAIARRLAAAGTGVVLVARSRERLDALAEELRGVHTADVEVLVADLSDRAQLEAVERVVADEAEPVDLLVNNAGYGFSRPFGEIPVDDEDSEIQVNVVALMRLSHAAVHRMRPARHGGILLVSSTSSFQPLPRTANYAATKAYVTSFGQALHEELRGDGVIVTTICPGLTHTGFHTRGGQDMSDVPEWAWQTADQVAQAALAGLDRGRALVVTGLVNKGLQVTVRSLPESLARRATAAVVRRRSGLPAR